MATKRQRNAARQNVKMAQTGALRRLDIRGRSKPGKAELKRAVARAR